MISVSQVCYIGERNIVANMWTLIHFAVYVGGATHTFCTWPVLQRDDRANLFEYVYQFLIFVIKSVGTLQYH